MELLLGIIAFTTSLIAAIIGFGGGMLLIAVLPMFLSPAIIIPIHGITQIASNTSRALFSISYVKWSLLPAFLIGSVIGTLLFGLVLYNLPTTYIPAAIGLYLLLNIWYKPFANYVSQFENYYVIGVLQTGLGLLVGATGPLSLSVLTKQLKCKDEIIATSAVFMTLSHLAKVPVFAMFSSTLLQSGSLILYMVIGSIAGSYCGSKLRLSSNNAKLIWIIKLTLTALAIKMLASLFISQS
ncbi:sulfite exporter TauE/SafE family protein [Pseudoalteromonas luteoviolacea]|uniref:sulfite exporter TauE/SafE family protein n=1 Tax=Pseudoalteromonas luteoviolacea TaxID=43657 RepID=UPI001B370597|nr:sulfite exporter TauE/SafE family protein [Pseudoalteromonas luteoviolacea]MBQ4835666.1 sulfite exporter TauE/SafE family protein [Pseudoalteromonas luteoviolacea]